MKEKTVYQCDFCDKTYCNASATKRHEKVCFSNPETHSCATCLWCSLALFNDYPRSCYINELPTIPHNTLQKLKTACPKWVNIDVAEEVELLDNEEGILDQLMSGDSTFFNTLEKLVIKGKKEIGKY